MEVYAIAGRISSYVRRLARTGEERCLLGIVISGEKRFRYDDLIAYGLDDGQIQRMVDDGFLKRKHVSRNTALSIAGYHKARTDKDYRSRLLDSLEKGRAHTDQRVRMDAVHKALRRKYASRRRSLMKEVILPEFSVGGKLPEEGVSIQDVVDKLRDYPGLIDRYPAGIYDAVMNDMIALGIKRSPASFRNKKVWERKLMENPEIGEMLRKRIADATVRRMEIYRSDPARAKADYDASAATRREKLRTDNAFREQVRANLALGPAAFHEKCRTDKRFGKKMRKAQMDGLAKGLRTMKRRAALRRTELRTALARRFGNIYDYPARVMSDYLQEEMPEFVELHYPTGNPYYMIKKDVLRLRALGL